MPQPTSRQVHINQPLTNISIAYIQDANNFIADRVFPLIPVQKQSDRYFKYERENWFKSEARKRAPGTESAGSGFEIDNTPSYFCDVYSVHKDIDDQIRANADEPINMDRDATEWVTQQLLLRREKIWANNFFDENIWGTEYQGVSSNPTGDEFLQWDNADSTPVEDITDAGVRMAELTGYRPNVLVISPFVFNTLKNHADILDRIKYTQSGMVTADILASLFEVDRVVVAYGVENVAEEGADGDFNFVMGNHALLAYANPTPSILQPSAGYIFGWEGLLGAGQAGNRIRTFRMEQLSSDRIEGDLAMDMKLIAEDLGIFFKDAIG